VDSACSPQVRIIVIFPLEKTKLDDDGGKKIVGKLL